MSDTVVFAPLGGMNQDDSIVGISPESAGHNSFTNGDYKYAAYARIGSTRSDNLGDVENIKGTTEVTAYYVRSVVGGGVKLWTVGARPSGTEKVIGKLENKSQRRLYYAVYNSNGNHCIRFYDPSTSRVYELLRWSGLNFTATMRVKMAMINNWLSLTDRTNPARLMDVDAVSDLYLDLTTNFREFHISFHKWAPVMPPIVRKYYDGVTNNYEKFQYRVLQFKYRYHYIGKLKSRWSPASVSINAFDSNVNAPGAGRPITAIELYMPGFILDQPGANTQYNYFGHDNIKFTSAVEKIEIAYRERQDDVWRTFKVHTVAASGNTTFRYTGNATGVPVDQEDINQPFDTVPFLAGTVEAIDNRFIFSDILDEQPPADTPVVTDVGYVKWGSPFTISGYWNYPDVDLSNPFSGLSGANATELGRQNAVSDFTFKKRGQYKPGIVFMHYTGWISGVYTVDNWFYDVPQDSASAAGEEIGLTFKLSNSFKPPSWAIAYMIVRSNCLNIDYHMTGIPNSFQALIDNATKIKDITSIPDELKGRIREHFENARLVQGNEIKDVYEKYLKDKNFSKSVAQSIRNTIITSTLSSASRIYIDIDNWYNSSKANTAGDQNNPMNKLFYNYREGDRVRFNGATVSNPNASQIIRYDVPILECTGRGIIIEKPPGLLWLPGITASVDNNTDPIIEVYTPKVPNLNDFIYYEVGEWYPVLYPGHASRDFAKRDWTYTNNAAITATTYGNVIVFNKFPFAKGDCHFFQRTLYRDFSAGFGGNSISVGLCSMNQNPNETWSYWDRGNGRPNVGYKDLPVSEFKTTMMRFGGRILEGSYVNSINRFRDQDQKIFPLEYGRIRGMVNVANAQVESAGAILLVIAEREAYSIYVNRVILEELGGTSSIAESEKVLGSYNVLLGSHGTLNPESISVARGRVTWWNAIDGCWVRYGRDGLTEISKIKMHSWFKDLGKLLISKYGTAEEPQVISEYDNYNEETTTHISHSSLPATFRDYSIYKGAVFSEEDRRWKSCHGYAAELYGKIQDELISFVGGRVWVHEQSSSYNSIYGSKVDSYIEPVFTDKNMKAWENISLISTHKWSVERFLSEYRGAKTKQQSVLLLANFNEKEDRYDADIKCDQNSPNASNPVTNGNKMRSKALRALLKLDPSVVTLSLLHYVEVGWIDSNKNN